MVVAEAAVAAGAVAGQAAGPARTAVGSRDIAAGLEGLRANKLTGSTPYFEAEAAAAETEAPLGTVVGTTAGEFRLGWRMKRCQALGDDHM